MVTLDPGKNCHVLWVQNILTIASPSKPQELPSNHQRIGLAVKVKEAENSII